MENERNLQLKALKLIDRFNPSCDSNCWAFEKIDKQEFLVSLRRMIESPQTISQGVHPLCGIASMLKIAVELDPVGVVKMGAHLFAKGVYQKPSFLQKKVRAPKSLRKVENVKGLSPAEHVLQTTIKSFYNPITGYNNKPGTLFNEWQGITFPFQLSNFLKSYFKIERIDFPTFRHSVKDIQNAINEGTSLLAWTSWNQMIHPGGKFKLLKQHYVILRQVIRVGKQVQVIIDNPRQKDKEVQHLVFETEKQFYKALIGVYAFRRKSVYTKI